jgi:hypothetical protein
LARNRRVNKGQGFGGHAKTEIGFEAHDLRNTKLPTKWLRARLSLQSSSLAYGCAKLVSLIEKSGGLHIRRDQLRVYIKAI